MHKGFTPIQSDILQNALQTPALCASFNHMAEKDPAKLGNATILRIAVEADVDPRTVRNVLDGEPIKSRSAERVMRVLAHRGIQVTPKPKKEST
jgi:hypothetical protein